MVCDNLDFVKDFYFWQFFKHCIYKDHEELYINFNVFFYLSFRAIEVPMMDRLEKFQIIFNNPTATYCAGETVYGYGWVMLKESIFVESKLIIHSYTTVKPVYKDQPH